MNKTLMTGAGLGFLSVAFGAYTEHVLKQNILPEQFALIAKALNYHQLYSLVILSIALCLYLPLSHRLKKYLNIAALFFIFGVMCFSFSIYLAVLTGKTAFLHAAPFGGTALMLAWLLLLFAGTLRE